MRVMMKACKRIIMFCLCFSIFLPPSLWAFDGDIFKDAIQGNQKSVVAVLIESNQYSDFYFDVKDDWNRAEGVVERLFFGFSILICSAPAFLVCSGLPALFLPLDSISERGSGFILDSEGYILTNRHVVGAFPEVIVKLYDDTEWKGRVINRDWKTDLAIIKIDATADVTLYPVRLGDSDEIEVGDLVVAMGNPVGLEKTVTAGIISHVSRRGSYVDLIQTDAALNPGNSGGPLINAGSAVIGVNQSIVAFAQNLGFAIPINVALGVLDDLKMEGKEVQLGTIGVTVRKNNKKLKEDFHLEADNGFVVVRLEKRGSASRVGLQLGDVVYMIDEKPLHERLDWIKQIDRGIIGREIRLGINRMGQPLQLSIPIEEVVRRRNTDFR